MGILKQLNDQFQALEVMRKQFDESVWMVQFWHIYNAKGGPEHFFRFAHLEKRVCILVDVKACDVSKLDVYQLIAVAEHIRMLAETSRAVFPYEEMTDERFASCLTNKTSLPGFAACCLSTREIQDIVA